MIIRKKRVRYQTEEEEERYFLTIFNLLILYALGTKPNLGHASGNKVWLGFWLSETWHILKCGNVYQVSICVNQKERKIRASMFLSWSKREGNRGREDGAGWREQRKWRRRRERRRNVGREPMLTKADTPRHAVFTSSVCVCVFVFFMPLCLCGRDWETRENI